MRKITMDEDTATTLALTALVWILEQEDRAQRLLALTGLDAQSLRESAGDPATHLAILDYLAGYEPDLVACAEALAVAPEQLIRAQHCLAGGGLSGGEDWG